MDMLVTIPVGVAQSQERRELIDRVLRLVNERTMLMHSVAAWKWLHDVPVVDSSREDAVIGRVAREAVALGLEARPVRHVFQIQMRCARAVQEQLHDRWHRYGFDHDLQVGSLRDELRTRIDALTRPLIAAISSAMPALVCADFRDVGAARAAQLLGKEWSATDRAELLAALAAVRSKEHSSAGVLL